MLEIELKSRELKESIYLDLEKNREEPLYDTDLAEITEIQLNKLDLIGDETDVVICDLVFFKNLKVCYLSNMRISDKDLEILNNLKTIEFLQLDNCVFSNNRQIDLNLLGLVINDCQNVKLSIYNNIHTLEKLHIVNCSDVNINGISKLENLQKLFLQNLELDEINEVKNMKNLQYLNLNGSKINNLEEIYKDTKFEIEHNDVNTMYDEEF